MRKIQYLCGILMVSLFLSSCGETQQISEPVEKSQPQVEQNLTVENAISEEEIGRILEYLSSDELEGRQTGTAGIEKAAVFIENYFSENGIEPFYQTYRDSFEVKSLDGYNIVGYLEGTNPELKDEVIIIGAHYDHVGSAKAVNGDTVANGANDNASGTTAVLQLAKYFAANKPKRSMIFALFSAEEMGLVGAKELAKKMKAEALDLYLMFNIEMIGVPMTGKDHMAYLTGFEKSNLAEKFNEYAGNQVLGFLPEAKQYNLFQRSDNYAFFEEFGVPAQTVSTFDFTNYEYYHHVDDEFEHMDLGYMEQLIEALIPGITRMANSPEMEIKMNR